MKWDFCREMDLHFVSRAYADVCSCPTNVTSHNPEKLYQSHLITHIHAGVLHIALIAYVRYRLQSSRMWMSEKAFNPLIQNVCHYRSWILLLFEIIIERKLCVVSYSQSYFHCLQHFKLNWKILINKSTLSYIIKVILENRSDLADYLALTFISHLLCFPFAFAESVCLFIQLLWQMGFPWLLEMNM